ncbi:hypothetical protein [Shewanella waksmanii]|uniref:hypothetical protein n=1 Tax=Shewanella waksmanii TaxID=213783 RepID=UPI003735AD80
MEKVNGVDIGNVVKEALAAAKAVGTENWADAKDIVDNIAQGFLNDLKFIAKKKAKGEYDEYDAKIFLEDQKMVARVRLRSLAIVTLQIAERMLNAVIEVFKNAATAAFNWALF